MKFVSNVKTIVYLKMTTNEVHHTRKPHKIKTIVSISASMQFSTKRFNKTHFFIFCEPVCNYKLIKFTFNLHLKVNPRQESHSGTHRFEISFLTKYLVIFITQIIFQ